MKNRIVSILVVLALVVTSLSIFAGCTSGDHESAAKELTAYYENLKATYDFTAENRTALDNAGVIWQIGILGKVDQGGGGTVAAYMANRNIVTVDAGVPVISMHAPMELVSKLDAYMTFKGMKVFYEAAE